ncbi:VOC family protein [Pseudoalteromonas tunicata]|uniref:VOC family protein n=1 Tax=Pseudoalteromonas tunicata TaxID=314281 RepID=UPI00273D641E|nr:VOC family protein [Pseudoalteromonas tunicata]MDP5215098.1 VOC family protein [Pseudoalteromonas tunicata]
MLHILGIDHIVLRTTQLNSMVVFYTKVLGCQIERTLPELGLTQLRAGSALIDLVEVDKSLGQQGGGAPTNTANNLDHFCLTLKHVSQDDIRAHLTAHNIEVGDFTARYGAQGYGESVYIHDPQGNTLELRCEQAFNPIKPKG